MPKYQIERGVKPPTRGDRCPLMEMKVGDSFMFARDDWQSVNSQRSYFRRIYPARNWTLRKMSPDTFRCWRTK